MVTHRGWCGGPALAAWLLSIGSPLAAQTEATLGLGASIVEYDGFLASGAVVLAPALRFDSPRLSLSGQGSWTVFESGHGVLQGGASIGWLAGSRGWWRLELSSSAGGSEYAVGPAAGYLLAGARLHVFGTSSGGWIGLNGGAASGGTGSAGTGSAGTGTTAGPAGTPVEVTMAGWSVKNRLTVVGSAATTWLGRVRHLDLVGAIRWTSEKLELDARAGARPWARDPEGGLTEAFGEITVTVPLSRRLAVSLGGGKYPSDPVRQTLGAKYLSAGIRLRPFGKPAPLVPVLTGGVLRGRAVPMEERAPSLEIVGSAERRTLRVRAADATSVELMGDFTDWLPVALVRVAPGVWEIEMVVPAGVHRVNIRLNGGPWSAPGGARLEQTEFGGVVGIVVVP